MRPQQRSNTKGTSVGVYQYGVADFEYVAAGAAVLASGGGGSYQDAVSVLGELADTGWRGAVPVRDYDGSSNCCVLALMGSPDAAQGLRLEDIRHSLTNTVAAFEAGAKADLACAIPVEIGPINSIVPLLAAAMHDNHIRWVVNGDGAGRAVPELPQTTFAGNSQFAVAPCALADQSAAGAKGQSAVLHAPDAGSMEALAGRIVAAFDSISGIALWPSTQHNGYALKGNYIPGTLAQAWALGQYLKEASTTPSAQDVAATITAITGRRAEVVASGCYIGDVAQTTTAASLDTGVIRLDRAPGARPGTQSRYLYNLNENLLMYASDRAAPDALAPDSICYYSEDTGQGFSNARNDLALYYDFERKQSTGRKVSVIKVEAAPRLRATPGVVASFAGLLHKLGYAGALPYPG